MLASRAQLGAGVLRGSQHRPRALVAPRSSRNGPGAQQLDGDQYQQLLAVQRHLLQVDQARAKAVEDVELFSGQLATERAARAALERRVSELESELAAATARLESEPGQAPQRGEQGGQQQQPAAAAAAAPAPQPQKQQQPQQQPGAPASGGVGALSVATITINYHTGWHDTFIHYEADKSGWTQTPGVKMSRGSENNQRIASIPGNAVEFVLTNGHGEWDSPGRYTDTPSNYFVRSPGTYKLKGGRLERLSD
ncbi:MAG: hypothetical protein J3K34DRAFT_519011 [Monoraphidium minutum]|nr:MAG: hypothetical protein J3K34DRAFT_519011 [Monoraphidium minutum]